MWAPPSFFRAFDCFQSWDSQGLFCFLPLGSKWRFWQDHSQRLLRKQVTKCGALYGSLAGLLFMDILFNYLKLSSLWVSLAANRYPGASEVMPLGRTGVSTCIMSLFAGVTGSGPAQLFLGMADPFLINYLDLLTASLVILIFWSTLERQMNSLTYFPIRKNAAWATMMWLRPISFYK